MMIRLLPLLSLLSHHAHALCDNSHEGAILLSISINGRSIDKIDGGVTEYLSIINSASEDILQSNGQFVGIQTFGGTGRAGNAVDSTEPMLAIDIDSEFSEVSGIITNLETLSATAFDVNYGNAVSSTMSSDTMTALKAASGQKYHIIFAAGNPLQGNQGMGITPTFFDNPCANAITTKAASYYLCS